MKALKGLVPAVLVAAFLAGCAPRITLFTNASDPLKEVTLQGSAADKVQLVPITGIISDKPKDRVLRSMPSVVQEVASHLKLAEKDPRVKAVLFTIDTPGGTTTASDMIYHEILSFKKRTGKKVVVCMMNLATSGGYYISLPADLIVAHPTTVTGSVGVILMRPQVSGLLDKIGVAVKVNKSGVNKDMGSPFRRITPAEDNMLQDLTDALGRRFVDLVKKHRHLNEKQVAAVADARIFLARDAVAAGLVDKIGYLPDAIAEAERIAGLSADARVTTYRRTRYANDNIYNMLTSSAPTRPTSLVNTGPIGDLFSLDPGFYYIWPEALGYHE